MSFALVNTKARGTVWLALVIAALVAGPAISRAQTNETSRILFLHLQLKDTTVSLIQSTVRPGYLKPRQSPDLPGAVHFEITAQDGRSLWHSAMEDPRERRLEHQETPGSGKLKVKKEKIRDPEFMVRVPVIAEGRYIEFYRLEGAERKRQSLGKLELPVH